MSHTVEELVFSGVWKDREIDIKWSLSEMITECISTTLGNYWLSTHTLTTALETYCWLSCDVMISAAGRDEWTHIYLSG